jgi:hypothetical protein
MLAIARIPLTQIPYELTEEDFLPEIEILEEQATESEFYIRTLKEIEDLLGRLEPGPEGV